LLGGYGIVEDLFGAAALRRGGAGQQEQEGAHAHLFQDSPYLRYRNTTWRPQD
jgi:hypothetical protein